MGGLHSSSVVNLDFRSGVHGFVGATLAKTWLAPRKPALKKEVLWPIQYVRGIAASMVVWHHAREQLPGLGAVFPSGFGALGVDIFFVISGLIMTVTGEGATAGEFLRRRIVRVVPLYWLATILLVILVTVLPTFFRTTSVTARTLMESLLFIPHYSLGHPGKIWPLLVPGWSLNYEMAFYFLFAVALLLQRWYIVLAILVVAGTIGAVIATPQNPLVATYTSPQLLEFATGILIGRWWLQDPKPLRAWLGILLIVVGVAVLIVPPPHYATTMLGTGLIIFGCLNDAALSWHSPLLRALGDASYSIYLSHLFTLGFVRLFWRHVSNMSLLADCLFMAVAMIASVLAGVVVYRWIELPLLRVFRRSVVQSPNLVAMPTSTSV